MQIFTEFSKSGQIIKSAQRVSSVSHLSPQLSTSVTHKRATTFQPQNPSVPHQKPLGSTPKTLWFNTKNSSVHTPLSSITSSVPHQKPQFYSFFVWWVCCTEGFLVLNWGVFGVELRNFGVELRDFGCWKGVVLVWNRCVELRGSMWNWGVLVRKNFINRQLLL